MLISLAFIKGQEVPELGQNYHTLQDMSAHQFENIKHFKHDTLTDRICILSTLQDNLCEPSITTQPQTGDPIKDSWDSHMCLLF